MVKVIFYLTASVLILISCNNDYQKMGNEINNERDFEYYLEDVLRDRYSEIEFFDDSCLAKLQRGFIYANVWKDDYYLWEGCKFEPKKEFILNAPSYIDEFDFLAYFIEKDSIYEYEIYASYRPFDSFMRPIRFIDGNLIFDSVYVVTLYLEGGVQCGSVFMEGTDYSDTMKLGVYQVIESPEIKLYVDSILKERYKKE